MNNEAVLHTDSILQSEIIRKNTAAIADIQRQDLERRTFQERLAAWITDFAGSMAFVYLHAVWFGLWILLNIGIIHIPHLSHFDPFPFGLLTMIVSLEAIFLSTFVLIGQNQLSKTSERRADLDLQVNLLAEQKSAKTLEMLDQIGQQLDQMMRRFNYTPDPEVAALKVSPNPEDVLQVIEEAVKDETGERMMEVSEQVAKRVAADVTGEMEAVRAEVKDVRGEMREVVEDVEGIKENIVRQEKC